MNRLATAIDIAPLIEAHCTSSGVSPMTTTCVGVTNSTPDARARTTAIGTSSSRSAALSPKAPGNEEPPYAKMLEFDPRRPSEVTPSAVRRIGHAAHAAVSRPPPEPQASTLCEIRDEQSHASAVRSSGRGNVNAWRCWLQVKSGTRESITKKQGVGAPGNSKTSKCFGRAELF